MKEILHVVNYLNHPNQPYMMSLFRSLSSSASGQSHKVFCIKNLKQNDDIPFLSVGGKNRLLRFSTISYILKSMVFNHNSFNWEKGTFFKSKIKFLLKYEELLKSKANLVHVHHLHIVNSQIMGFLKSKNTSSVLSLRGRDLIVNTIGHSKRSEFLKMVSYFDKVHVNSEFLKRLAIERGVEKEKIVTIYRGLDPIAIREENLNTNSWSSKTEMLKIIVVSRLNWEKGLVYLIESLYRLTNKGYDIKCDIFGEGKGREFLEYRIHQMGLAEKVKLEGHVCNVKLKERYKNYHLTIQPSLYESLPNGLLEMCFHDLPCVASNVGGIQEFIKDGTNGILFDIKTPEEIDNAILEALMLEKNELKAYNKKLIEKFSFSKSIKSLVSLYENL